MLPLGVKIIGLVVIYLINIGWVFESSLMKAVSKLITVLCWTRVAHLYIESLQNPHAFLVILIKMMTLIFLYPMLCQFE